MPTIHPQPVTPLVREQFAALRERAAASRPAPGPAAPRQAAASTLAQAIAALAPADPDRRRKAVRLFLAAQIASALGEPVQGDPAFARLLDAVQDQMQADAQTAAAVAALGEWLVSARGLRPGGPQTARAQPSGKSAHPPA